MVQSQLLDPLPEIKPITTQLRSVDHLIQYDTNGECDSLVAEVTRCSPSQTVASKPRKANGNKGFIRSDRFTKVHRYSYNTLNKYRLTGLLGDDLFLPPTPKSGGRIRVHEDAATILREAGVRPRGRSSAPRRPSCKPAVVVETPEPAPVVDEDAEAKTVFTDLFVRVLGAHGTDFIIDCLIDAERVRRKSAT